MDAAVAFLAAAIGFPMAWCGADYWRSVVCPPSLRAMTSVWFITGTSTGLGRAIAEGALAQGDRVVATARDVGAIKDLTDQEPERALGVTLDVTDPDSIHAAVTAAEREFGRIDVLINNAGYRLRGAL